MGRTLTLGYGVLVYVLFLGTLVYFIGRGEVMRHRCAVC